MLGLWLLVLVRSRTYWAGSSVDDLVKGKSLWDTGGSVGVTRSEGPVVDGGLAVDGLALLHLGWATVGKRVNHCGD